MTELPFIAAIKSEDQMIKLIFGAIVFVVFIVGSLLKAVTKAKPNADPSKPTKFVWDEILGGVREVPNPSATQPNSAQSPRPKSAKKRKPGRPTPPPLPQAAAVVSDNSEIITARVNAVSAPSVVQRALPSRAVALSRSINPRTLRDQFILTEILAKPLALRE